MGKVIPMQNKYEYVMQETGSINLSPLSDSQQELFEMLQYARPHNSETELDFIYRYICPIKGIKADAFGNCYISIGHKPTIAYSCHTDTVHHYEGLQCIEELYGIAQLSPNSDASCLGADCTTGVWLMLNMIRANKPGLYIFHRGEECGGLGSSWIVDNTPELVKNIEAMIALDRYGYTDIITEQAGTVTASNKFALSLAKQLSTSYSPSDFGIFTDSANYAHLIPECTNIAVGYKGHHGQGETQDLKFASFLLDRLIALDYSKLEIARDPQEPTYSHWDHYERDQERWYSNKNDNGEIYYTRDNLSNSKDDRTKSNATHNHVPVSSSLTNYVRDYPEAVALLLEEYGLDKFDIMEIVEENGL